MTRDQQQILVDEVADFLTTKLKGRSDLQAKDVGPISEEVCSLLWNLLCKHAKITK